MTTKLTELDLAILLAEAKSSYLQHNRQKILTGMTRPLTEGEFLIIAQYEATLMLLNQKGLLREGAIEEACISFEEFDIDPLED